MNKQKGMQEDGKAAFLPSDAESGDTAQYWPVSQLCSYHHIVLSTVLSKVLDD